MATRQSRASRPQRLLLVACSIFVTGCGLAVPPTPQGNVNQFLQAFFTQHFPQASTQIEHSLTAGPPLRQDYQRIAGEAHMAGTPMMRVRWSTVCRPRLRQCTVTFNQRWLPPLVVDYATITDGSGVTHYEVAAVSWNAWINSIP
jgi:hypothetical protein